MMIEPDIDLYGGHARESALADFLELQTIAHGLSMSRETLADYIDDNDWTRKTHELVAGPALDPDPSVFFTDYDTEDWEDSLEEGRAFAQRVFDLLKERELTLGVPAYPFRVSSDGLRLVGNVEGPYGFLLASATGHALGIDTDNDPNQLVEGFVCRALERLNFDVINIGDFRRGGGFEERLLNGGQAIHLNPNPDAAYRSTFANDEGVDVVGHLWLGDMRPGRWVCIGQVTCGRSEDWSSKLREPSSEKWRKLLGMLVRPLPFLAVPQHVTSRRLAELVEAADGIVLDRLRLAKLGPQITPDEALLLQEIQRTDVLAA